MDKLTVEFMELVQDWLDAGYTKEEIEDKCKSVLGIKEG